MATFDETLFPCCPGAKTPARTDLSETPDPEGHIPHGTPDDGVMPPGPSSENSSQDDSNDNHGNEGPDYPGDLEDKSPESSPPPQYPKQPGLPHPSEVRHDMDDGIGCHADQVVKGTSPDVQETCTAKPVPPQRLRGTSCMIGIGKR